MAPPRPQVGDGTGHDTTRYDTIRYDTGAAGGGGHGPGGEPWRASRRSPTRGDGTGSGAGGFGWLRLVPAVVKGWAGDGWCGFGYPGG